METLLKKKMQRVRWLKKNNLNWRETALERRKIQADLRLPRTKFYYASSKIKSKIGKAFVVEARRHHLEVFLRGVLKICTKFTGEYLYRSVISIMFLCNFIEMALRYGCSPVSLLHIFRTPFPWNSSGWLLLNISDIIF